MAITLVSKSVAGGLAATDAGFRSLGAAVMGVFDDLGYTSVYNTMDWNTAAYPGSDGTYVGKKVYAFDDALSPTQEVYFSVEVGRGTASTAAIGYRVRFVVGTTHSSGTVSGQVQTHYIGIGSTTTAEGEIVGVRTDTGFTIFSNMPYTGSYAGQWEFCAERLRIDGEPTVDGLVTFTCGTGADSSGTNGTPQCQASNFALSTVYTANTTGWNCMPMAVRMTDNILIDYKCPVFPIYTFGKYDPFLGVILTTRSVPDLSVFSAKVDGVTHTYRSSSGNSGVDGYQSAGNVRPAFLVA